MRNCINVNFMNDSKTTTRSKFMMLYGYYHNNCIFIFYRYNYTVSKCHKNNSLSLKSYRKNKISSNLTFDFYNR